MKKTLYTAVALLLVSACAGLVPALRDIKDIAYDICSLTGAEQLKSTGKETIDGMSVSDWCKQAKVIKPFVDDMLAAKLAGVARVPHAKEATDAGTP
jgi:hypothetical protein